MRRHHRNAEQLAKELLGRNIEDVDAGERRVLERIAAGTVMEPDELEKAMLHASFGDRLADRVAEVGGSWSFIIGFAVVLFSWMIINSSVLESVGLHPFDGYPYIFLNLLLSTLAAIQAPIIMMSQNRQSDKDRIAARHDYEVNLRTQLEIIRLHRRFDRLVDVLEKERSPATPPGHEL